MPSVFPGMDPFIEADDWEDFHTRFVAAIADAIVPQVRPNYFVRTEKRIYVQNPPDIAIQIRPDVSILREPKQADIVRESNSATATIEPVERTLTSPVKIVERYLVIRRMETSEVVTVIEILSPSNKRVDAEGGSVYLNKRATILLSRTNLVEIDLLRGGTRLPTVEPLPAGDYFAFVCRAEPRYKAAVYAWPLNHQLPKLPIPLAPGDREVELDLQTVFDGVYDRAGYDYSVNYSRQLEPALNAAEASWVASFLPTTKEPSS